MTALRTSRAIGNDKRADRRTGRIWQFDSSHHAMTSGWSAGRKVARNGVRGDENAVDLPRKVTSAKRTSGPE